MEDKPRLLVLYASQTGNAMDAAEHVGREAERRACRAVVLSMDDYDASFLPHEGIVIFIVSTTGQGDTPDSMKVFWRFLLQRNLNCQWLEEVHYAVFGLGDSSYQKYNFVAKKLDKRLADLGARPIIERGLGDDQHPSGYEGALDPWLSSLWNMIKQIPTFSINLQVLDPDLKTVDSPKYQIIYHNIDMMQPLFSTSSDLKLIEMQVMKARSMSPGILHRNDNRPRCFLQMTKNQLLTKVGSGRDVRHFEFEALSSVIDYQVGDVLEVLPSQNPAAVDAFIKRCNLNPESYITVMSFFATAEHERERLQYFSSPEGRDDLYRYNQKERRTVLEVLEDFPSVQLPFEWLVQLIPPLKTRAFSISSSPSAHLNQVHLTVSVVSWMTPFKRKRYGLCSTWLAGLDPHKRVPIPAWFRRDFPPPPPSLPLILIGPGTGCAPFRAFVEERAVQSVSWPIAPVLFFFGCRNEDSDFLYRDFWLSHTDGKGVLSEEKGGGFFVAFSRDQPHKVYVQHKMQEQSERVWNLLSAGAAVYIAGSSTKMPADVHSCLEEIVSREGGVPRESAARWLRMLERDGRYIIETWS